MIKRIGQGNRNMHKVKEGTSRLNLGARLMTTVLLLSVCLMARATPPPPNPHIPLNAEVTVTYYHNDLLGSPVAATDEQGELIWREDYKPFGEKLENDPAASNDRLWYTGKSHDEDTGLTYFGARYYDPIVGRFMATDPVGFSESNPMLFNRYAYANNNPYRFVDPDGRSALTAVGGLIHETGQLLTGNGFDGGSVLGALKDGYNGEGGGIGAAIIDDATSFVPAGAAYGAAVKGLRLLRGAKAVDRTADVAKGVDPNKLKHIFGQERHNLSGVVKQFGSEEKAFNAIQQATEAAARSQGLKGVFETTVKVGAETVTVRGNVVDGAVKVGTAFIP